MSSDKTYGRPAFHTLPTRTTIKTSLNTPNPLLVPLHPRPSIMRPQHPLRRIDPPLWNPRLIPLIERIAYPVLLRRLTHHQQPHLILRIVHETMRNPRPLQNPTESPRRNRTSKGGMSFGTPPIYRPSPTGRCLYNQKPTRHPSSDTASIIIRKDKRVTKKSHRHPN